MGKLLALFLFAFVLLAPIARSADIEDGVIVLKPGNTIALRGEVDGMSVSKLIDALFMNNSEEVYLFIDSPGGSVVDGMRFIDVMKASGKKIICIANTAASMAFSILQSCDERYITEHGVIMQHVGSYGLRGQAPNNKSMTMFINRMFDSLNEIDAKRLGMTVDAFQKKIRDDWWLFGKDALAAKAVDGVVLVRCSKEMTEKRVSEEVATFFGSFTVIYSGCPIASDPLEIKTKTANPRMSAFDFDNEFAKFMDALSPRKVLMNRFLNSQK